MSESGSGVVPPAFRHPRSGTRVQALATPTGAYHSGVLCRLTFRASIFHTLIF